MWLEPILNHSTGLCVRHHLPVPGVDCISVSLCLSVQLELILNHSTGLGARHHGVDCVSVSLSVQLGHSLNTALG